MRMVEAKKLAFADRERWAADSALVRGRRSPACCRAEYTAELAARIDMRRAAPSAIASQAAAGDTTYFCTADGEGNAVSGIQSINSGFGAGIIAGDTGILLNNRMAYWHLEPGHPNRLAPGRRVRHTMNPPIVLKDGDLWCVFGTPGADNQVQVNLQVLTAMIDFGLDPQQAAEMPRWTSHVSGQYANWPHVGANELIDRAPLSRGGARRARAPRPPGRHSRRSRRAMQRRDHPPRPSHRHAAGRLRPAPRRLGRCVVSHPCAPRRVAQFFPVTCE